MKKFYVTTPIYYVNSEPHIGSAYTTIVADIVARYKRMMGYDVFFLTGTDEHGQKVMQSAEAKGISPKEFADELSNKFRVLWQEMGITNDYFVRTTDEQHEKVVQKIVKKLKDNGDIYKGKYEGNYCISCEAFFNDDEVVVRDGKKTCPDCGKELKWVEEENYFFKLSKYNDALLKLYEENPEFVEPEFRKNEMLSLLKKGLNDISITRTTFSWGIPVPDDPKHVVYVWVDALINYISAIGYEESEKFKKYWPADVHFIGKEINRFHSLIWPAILMAANIELPKKVFAHGWLTVNGEKISKSKGNAVDPRVLMNAYGKDVIRYYLLRDITFGKDGDFSEDSLITRYNADLANDLSNLVHRTLSMLDKYFNGVILEPNKVENVDDELHALIEKNSKKYFEFMDKYQFTHALEALWEIVRFSNKYIDLTEPWKLGKDESKKDRLSTVMYNLADSIRNISILISPIMPETSEKILKKLGYDKEHINFKNIKNGGLHTGVKVSRGKPVFQRLDMEKWEKVIKIKEEKENENIIELIEISDFKKVQLKVARVITAEPIPKSKKLLRLILNDGSENNRQILAGISQFYKPEELIGKNIIIVANLKPAKLMGQVSNGMLLAAKNGDNLTILTTDKNIEPGSLIS